MRGYSDRINHAFAFAAVHHEGQFRGETRVPYVTHLANVAMILARYDQDEDTIIAAILHDVVEDCEAHTPEEHADKIREKFGPDILASVRSVTKPPHRTPDGRDLSPEERHAGYTANLATAGERALWVCAADKVHNSRCTISDLRRTGDAETVWGRFRTGRNSIQWYREVIAALEQRNFDAPIMDELRESIDELEQLAKQSPS
jgi:(p)ppGpp synthase/HD superfamily hydrolase